MRKLLLIGLVIVLGGGAVALGIRATTSSKSALLPLRRETPPAAAVTTSAAPLSAAATPADRQVLTAQAYIQHAAGQSRGYNLLASAYMQKARETGDFGFNQKAEAAITRAFEITPDDFDAIILQAKLLLTYHRFPEALAAARRAQALKPDDHNVYGAMTDALVELGDYDGAIAAAQRMVDLRPDTTSYSRVSYIRSLRGDTKGAIGAMRFAVESASPSDPEGRAWCRAQLGEELLNNGQLKDGEREIDHALFDFPDYHVALAAKGRARLRAGDAQGATTYLERAVERVPLPEYVIWLGDLYAKLGRADDARRQYQLVEFIERDSQKSNTYSRQLALFYADHDIRLDDALAIARREREQRQDVFTEDALAWCLYKKGQLAEAQASMSEALRLGTRDARMLYHAGVIARARGDLAMSAKYLRQALDINPAFDPLQADDAHRLLSQGKA